MTEQERLERKREVPDLEPEELFLARVHAKRAARKAREAAAAEAKKPKLVITPSPEVAAAVEANPGSLRVWAKASAEAEPVVDRPRQAERFEVLEVDAQARPVRVKRLDCTTGEVSIEEWVGGYRPTSIVEHVYDPITFGLGRNEND